MKTNYTQPSLAESRRPKKRRSKRTERSLHPKEDLTQGDEGIDDSGVPPATTKTTTDDGEISN